MRPEKEITQGKNIILEHQDELDFPKLLELLRKVHGYTRCEVCNTISISTTKLFFLEKGLYVKKPKKEVIFLLSRLYDVSYSLLCEKSEKFLTEKKNSPQRYGVRWQDWRTKNFDSMLKEKVSAVCQTRV